METPCGHWGNYRQTDNGPLPKKHENTTPLSVALRPKKSDAPERRDYLQHAKLTPLSVVIIQNTLDPEPTDIDNGSRGQVMDSVVWARVGLSPEGVDRPTEWALTQ